jgi:sugar phosphate isomerase/epimerase
MQLAAHRREFLRTAGGLTAGALFGSLALGAPDRVAAIEPLRRNGQPKFKFSLAAYSYRSLLKGAEAPLTLSDFIRDCARFGLEGTELTSYYFPAKVTPEYLRQLKQECFLLGLDVSGTAVGNDFGLPDAGQRQEQIDHVKTWCNHAEILGAPVIRVFAGRVRNDVPAEQAHRQMVDALQECCDYAGTRGIHLALENHGGPTATPEGLLKLVRDVQSPWFGVNLDTGNFHTEDVYGDLARVADYAINVQVKATISGPGRGDKRPADFARIAGILRDAAYRGYVVLEYEEAGDPREECPKVLDQLRAAFAG